MVMKFYQVLLCFVGYTSLKRDTIPRGAVKPCHKELNFVTTFDKNFVKPHAYTNHGMFIFFGKLILWTLTKNSHSIKMLKIHSSFRVNKRSRLKVRMKRRICAENDMRKRGLWPETHKNIWIL